MWIGVGVLLGLVVVASVLGFHVGPHGHLAGAGLGLAAAVWLVIMAATGRSGSLVWVLLGADTAISGGLATIAWRGLKVQDDQVSGSVSVSIVGAEGVAVTDLVPGGVVRVRGENWSATLLNGTVKAGSPIQVIEAGVRLGVWSEDAVAAEVEEHSHSLLSAHWHHHSAESEHKGEQ
jgi:membrane-bound ClpP family serine protease